MPLGVVGVIDEPVAILLLKYRTVTGAGPATSTCYDERAAAIEHRFAAPIDVWTSEAMRAADANVVSAVVATATEVERDEEVVVTILPNNVGRLDCARRA